MDLIQHESEQQLSREQAAAQLRELADQLSKNNGYTFDNNGIKTTVDVPSKVTLSIEVEVGDDGSEIEVEIRW